MKPVESNSLTDAIQAALDEAHAITAEKGPASPEAAAAWDVVEELQAEAGHQRDAHYKTAFEQYCEDYPEAIEARVYDS